MASRIPDTAQGNRPSYVDTSSTDFKDIHKHPQRRPFGMASFTDEDLSALSRRKIPLTIPSACTTTPQPLHLSRRSMTPLEEHDDESVISAIPTGLRAQQEIVSALQKENFRLKLSLHSHRRKETLQNARLESTSSALQDIELKKNGLEKTLKTLKGEIIAGYRNLEKLVSEQLDGDKSIAPQPDDRSSSRGSSKREVKISTVHDQLHSGPKSPKKQTPYSTQRSPKPIQKKPTEATPTKRHIIESSKDKQQQHLPAQHNKPIRTTSQPQTASNPLSNKVQNSPAQAVQAKQRKPWETRITKPLSWLHIPLHRAIPHKLTRSSTSGDSDRPFVLFRRWKSKASKGGV